MPNLLLLLFLAAIRVAGAESCNATRPLADSDMNPRALEAWLDLNGEKLRHPGDLVCCLPDQYRKNYAIGHSSFAFQRGTPERPRVLMFEEMSRTDFQMILTVNGGDNIEIVYQDPVDNQNRFFDLEFGSRRKRLAQNPTLCLACHGDRDGQIATGGPHANFELTGNWPRFVAGAEACANAVDENILRADHRAIRAVLEDEPYRCLDKKPLRDLQGPLKSIADAQEKGSYLRSQLFNVDFKLNTQNARRIAYILAAQKNYPRFKFALLAYTLCELSTDALPRLIPEPMLSALYARVPVTPALNDDADWPAAFAKIYGASAARASAFRTPAPASERELLRDGINFVNNGPLTCERAPTLPATMASIKQKILPRDQRLAADIFARASVANVSVEELLSLYLASNGTPLSGLSMSLFPDELSSNLELNFEIGKRLARFENPDSELRELLPESALAQKLSGERCEALARLSRAALTL